MGMKINGKKTEVIKVSDDPSPMKVVVAGVLFGRNQVVQISGSSVQLRGVM